MIFILQHIGINCGIEIWYTKLTIIPVFLGDCVVTYDGDCVVTYDEDCMVTYDEDCVVTYDGGLCGNLQWGIVWYLLAKYCC